MDTFKIFLAPDRYTLWAQFERLIIRSFLFSHNHQLSLGKNNHLDPLSPKQKIIEKTLQQWILIIKA